MRRLINSPLKILGLLTAIIGLLSVLTVSYFFFVGIYLVGIGLLIYLIDYIVYKLLKVKKTYLITQYSLSIVYLILAFITYMKWQEHNIITFPENFEGEAGIIFGIEDYPQLPKTIFWKKEITIPKNGVLITSTKEEDIPNIIRFRSFNNKSISADKIIWEPNFSMNCVVNSNEIRAWLFQVGSKNKHQTKDSITELCNKITQNQTKSIYKSQDNLIVLSGKEKYLNLQNKGLSSLPDGIDKFNIYRIILTGNDFLTIPKQILEMTTLEDLIFAVNPISEFPCSLAELPNLKSVSFAETNIREINCDLSGLKKVEDIDLARNQLTVFPEKIKTIPNLKWLSLNDNSLTSLSFVDDNLEDLEILYLYSNKVNKIGSETKYLSKLKELLIFDNQIDSILDNIGELKNLEKLEIWDNPIIYISPKISKLTRLKSLRMDDDFLTQEDKDNLRRWLPNCKINFQTRSEK